MCGIAGFYDTTRSLSRDVLVKMTDLLSYRGPDDSGYSFITSAEGNVGLGHRRLSIIDLSPLGHQPMVYENLSVIYNGEVYNFMEIREELKKSGYEFISTSDTEVILKAFHKWGIDAVKRFNGMFALAMYDSLADELFLVRDRVGVKPLYYFYDQQNLVFGSELKPLMNCPLSSKGRINRQALNSFLFHGYINAPHSIFQNVYKLEPGHYLKYKNKSIEIKDYWSIESAFKESVVDHSLSEGRVIDKLDEIITSSVRYRMISDVPIGSFLSGGIDSSLVSAVMQKLSPGRPINTFTIGFNEEGYNEAHFAEQVASHLKTNHHQKTLPVREAQSLISRIPIYFDEPFADSSQLPTMLVSEMARKNVTVVLTGDGGDEFFCGYPRYAVQLKYLKYRSISAALRPLKSVPGLSDLLTSVYSKATKIFHVNNHANIINRSYLFSQHYLQGLVKGNTYEMDRKFFDIIDLSPDNIQEAYMLQDMITYLPDDILAKVDRAAMSFSLEGREPLLDYRLIEYSFTIPHALKFKNGELKYLLKQLAYRYIPKELIDRPKMGFGVPVYQWLRSDLRYLIERYLSEQFIEDQGIFDFKKIRAVVDMFYKTPGEEFFASLVWHTLVFQMWYEKYRGFVVDRQF